MQVHRSCLQVPPLLLIITESPCILCLSGIRLGDVIYGVNFIPTREGSKTLISIIKKETGRGKTHIHIQGWRCHQLCKDSIPGYHFPRADEVLVQAYSLVQSKVFSDWERWNFIEILLG